MLLGNMNASLYSPHYNCYYVVYRHICMAKGNEIDYDLSETDSEETSEETSAWIYINCE